MARVRDEKRFAESREALLAVGQDLFINGSFNSVGLNDILKHSGIPKGSFYHYFDSKEDFGLQVVEQYARQNLQLLDSILAQETLTPYQQLKKYFETNIRHFDEIGYCQGCLMANLSQELADVNECLRCKIDESTSALTGRVAECIEKMDSSELNLGHLEADEAAQLLMISFNGAMAKMKMGKSRKPLNVFMKCFFSR